MEQVLTFLSTLFLILAATIVAADNSGAAEGSNAQAVSGDSGSSSGGVNSDKILLVRRYVPRFVGKRDPEDAELDNDNVEHSEKTSDDDLGSLDEYLKYLSEYYDDLNLSDLDAANKDSLSEADIGTELDSYQESKDGNSLLNTQDEKRYVPSFVGKRYGTLEDEQDDLLSEEKRYRPRFVGKRYQPRFVGKRFAPRFVGKRYTPRFIGKRYTPRFVGKRYTPRFVGKRYTPRFVGKRYTPKFIGKRYTPRFIGKRYTPKFIGKRFEQNDAPASSFLDKRYKPFFVGKRNMDQEINENHVEKRSVSETNEELHDEQENTEHSLRRKRSIADTNEESYKRAWGTYIPLKSIISPAYKGKESQSSYVEKRFVAPEFIGRRDSLSTILSALDALQFARTEPRSASKRFEAPLFIGKRAPSRPFFVGKRDQIIPGDLNTQNEYGYSDNLPGISEFRMGAYESIPDEYTSFRDIYPYSNGFDSVDL